MRLSLSLTLTLTLTFAPAAAPSLGLALVIGAGNVAAAQLVASPGQLCRGEGREGARGQGAGVGLGERGGEGTVVAEGSPCLSGEGPVG
jgi:hypothetical protein